MKTASSNPDFSKNNYPCFIFKTRTLTVRIKEVPLAIMIGNSLSLNPYITHSSTPIVKNTYINNEISLAFRVLIVLISCGSKEPVVQMPASTPIVFVMPASKIIRYPFYFKAVVQLKNTFIFRRDFYKFGVQPFQLSG